MRTRYTTSHDCFDSMPEVVRSRILAGMAVCDIGGGANALLSRDKRETLGLVYTVIDVNPSELAKAPDDVCKVELDITAIAPSNRFDLVISIHLAEHVRDPKPMHRNVHTMLNPGGLAIHFFPTLYTAPFILNRVIPERVSERILLRLQPHRTRSGDRGKFPAYYRWCRGPTRRQVRRLTSMGFEIGEYVCRLRTRVLLSRAAASTLRGREDAILLRHPIPLLASYAIVVLRRPLA